MKAEGANETTFKDIFKQIVGNDSYQAIADKIGVTRQNIYYWINGKSLPDTAALIKIADAYNVTVDYLLGRKQLLDPFYSNAEIRRYMERFAKYSDFTESWITEYAKSKIVGKYIFVDKPWTEQDLETRLNILFSSAFNQSARPDNVLYPLSFNVFWAIEDAFYELLCGILGVEKENGKEPENPADYCRLRGEIRREMHDFKNSAASACSITLDDEYIFFELYEGSRLKKAAKGLIGNETIGFLRSSKHISSIGIYTERIREAAKEGD